jgi:hypothetical protein
VIFAERSSIWTSDAFRSTTTSGEDKQRFKVLGRRDPHIAEANNDRARIGERAWFPASWKISLLVLAAARGESASAEAAHKRMMMATRNCRTLANTLMIKVKNTRCSFQGQGKSNISKKKCSILPSRVENPYVLA